LKEKEKLAELLLFHADSLTPVKVDNQHKTAANCCFKEHKLAASNADK